MAVPAAREVERLKWGKFSPVYRGRLLESGQTLQAYLRRAKLSWRLVQCGKSHLVDELLVQFIHELHSAGSKSGLRLAKHAVLFVQVLRPRLRKSLQGAWEAIKSWEEQNPSHFRPPLPLPLLVSIVCKARVFAEGSDNNQDKMLWMAFSVLVLTGFFGLLRPGELFNVRSHDVVLPNSFSMAGEFAVIKVSKPKNARQMGSQQYVELRHPDVVNWLAWLKSRAKGQEAALWPSSAAKFRVMFKHVCSALQLNSLKLAPASLRAGGATWLVDEGVEISRIRFMGRWAHMRSLEHYIQVDRKSVV